MNTWALAMLVVYSSFPVDSAQIQVLYPENLRNRYPTYISAKAGAGWKKPYGSYISGAFRVQEKNCTDLKESDFLLVHTRRCALEIALNSRRQTNPKIIVLKEQESLKEVEYPVLLLESSVADALADTLTGYSGLILLNITFGLNPTLRPTWEVLDDYRLEEVQSYLDIFALFRPEDVNIVFNPGNEEIKKDSTLVINGLPYDGSVGELKRALCASFSSPGEECAEFFCASGCWVDLLENEVCDVACNNPSCNYDGGACSVDSESDSLGVVDWESGGYTGRNLQTNSSDTQQNCTYQDAYTGKTFTKPCYEVSTPTWAVAIIIVLTGSCGVALYALFRLFLVYIMYALFKLSNRRRQELMVSSPDQRMPLNRNTTITSSTHRTSDTEPTLVIEDQLCSIQFLPNLKEFTLPICAICMVE